MESPVQTMEKEMARAMSLEKSNELREASKLYEILLKQHPDKEKILTRLMINYRKLKEYKKELKHIEALIKIQQSLYRPQKRMGALVISISEKINKSLGATDKKGQRIYTNDAVKTLEKRKLLVEKKIAEK